MLCLQTRPTLAADQRFGCDAPKGLQVAEMPLCRSRCCLYDYTPDLRFAGKTGVSKRAARCCPALFTSGAPSFWKKLPIIVMIIGTLRQPHLGQSISKARERHHTVPHERSQRQHLSSPETQTVAFPIGHRQQHAKLPLVATGGYWICDLGEDFRCNNPRRYRIQ